ncbi:MULTISPECIES: SepM family pheromone-processing serine protease [Cytobacillus]|uniref:SepM family pheromone-processing serine protease n=1 Tax=Cytobacillus TaxID=2675230 RepID=UPI00203BA484|nr:SepM family pheromone-processing serine protease [Cytobacillus firmus]MCM3706167.1 PDZ domain-containing protein [Cytobacillus firmus]
MRSKFYTRSFLILAVILVASSFYYLPYYVSKPGMAKELEPIIEVENGYEEQGSFMLTTVRMGRANIYAYMAAKFSKYQELYPVEEIRAENETDEEYNVRQLHMMATSKLAAIETAYKKAGLPIHYLYNGVYVLNVRPDMPADGKLQAGDRIFKVDGREFESSEEFISAVSNKQEGSKITLTFERQDKTIETSIPLKTLEETGKPGVGITLVDDKEIKVEPAVNIDSEAIGGPSAGLMFSLEIYNQLIKEDLTGGYKIAGTGTINSEGTVGRIGGIEQKIVAADKAGAEIFLAPNENGAEDSNYNAAAATARDIKTDMKIVPVDTFDDAVEYLRNLE